VTATVDWTARIVTVEGTEFGVAFCEGEAPLLCITSPDGDHLGAFEHAEFDAVDDLEAHAKEFSMTMREDRVAGCDPAFELEPATTVETTLFGAPGVRYGYTGSIAGREVERVVAHAANVDGRLHLVTANFLADDGCMSRESELPIGVADALEPVLDAVVAGSTR